MDLLQKELQRKKEALAKAKQAAAVGDDTSSRKRKFIRQGDLRRMEEEEEEKRQRQQLAAAKRAKKEQQQQQLQQQQQQQQQQSTPVNDTTAALKKKKKRKKTNDKDQAASSDTSKSASNSDPSSLSSKTITARLRVYGLPIRYFGETHEMRLQRLQEALEKETQTLQGLSEMEEFRLGKGHGIRNQFLERDNDDKPKKNQQQPNQTNEKEASKTKPKEPEPEDDTEDDPPKRIYKYLKGLLKEWEHDLSERPDSVAKSVAGRNESKTLKQCKDYIRPLFKQLKQRKIEEGLQAHLLEIVSHAQQGEFVKAHDAYINVAIGRAAWPIGVTMVGIHARSGRAKIESSNVAHVMNSELQRKYLTSVKRLLSYAQKKRTDVDPSKKVM